MARINKYHENNRKMPLGLNGLSCVYFLLLDGKVVYIGETGNLYARIVTHKSTNMKFSHFRFIECIDSIRKAYERRWIKLFSPDRNILGLSGKRSMGRKRLYHPEKLEIGEKMKLKGKMKLYPYAYCQSFNSRGEEKFKVFFDGQTPYIERIL